MNKVFGSFVASAVASFVMAVPVLAEHEGKPHAAGTAAAGGAAKMACQNNSCKGKAACKGFGNDSCKGHNSCKGHGTVKAKDEAACKKAGGTWAEMK